MFERILVPLDGSLRAEQAIPIAAKIARSSGGSVILLRVVTHPIESAAYVVQVPSLTEQMLDARHAKAEDYLTTIAASDALVGVTTSRMVADSIPAQTILSAARLQKVNLIVMCSQGVSGLTHWALGSVAQKVVRHSPVPVLVLRENDAALTVTDEKKGMQMLVPLDGSELAESIIMPAAQLCAALSTPAQGTMVLTQVYPLPSEEGFEVQDITISQQKEAMIAMYLSSVKERLQELATELHLRVTTNVTSGVDVAQSLVEEAEHGIPQENSEQFLPFDIIAMATHGRDGSDFWVFGSIAERVFSATKLPLLIVRPQRKASSGSEQDTEDVLEGSMSLL